MPCNVQADGAAGDAAIQRYFNPFPKYLQIREILRQWLQRDFAPGDRFPTEIELKKHFGVSRETIREALLGLEEDGWITRRAGQGTFVSQRPAHTTEARLTGLSEGFRELGLELTARFLGRGSTPAKGAVAELAQVEEGTSLHRLTYLQIVEGRILAHVEAYLPEETGHLIAPSNNLDRGLIREVHETLALRIWEDQQRVEAAVADRRLAGLLKVKQGAPLLLLTRLMKSGKGDFAILYRSLYRSDAYYYSLKLPRGGA